MATLELYLIRHGVAAERGEEYPDDSKRPLTSEGIARLRKEAQGARRARTSASIRSSRARSCARGRRPTSLPRSLKAKPAVANTDALAPAGTPAAVMQELGKHMRKARIALVGHEPNMGELAARLIGARTAARVQEGRRSAASTSTVFPPKGNGALRWFITPKMLRKLQA